jgi:hypothetical protein
MRSRVDEHGRRERDQRPGRSSCQPGVDAGESERECLIRRIALGASSVKRGS